MFDDVGIGAVTGRSAGFALESNIKKNDLSPMQVLDMSAYHV